MKKRKQVKKNKTSKINANVSPSLPQHHVKLKAETLEVQQSTETTELQMENSVEQTACTTKEKKTIEVNQMHAAKTRKHKKNHVVRVEVLRSCSKRQDMSACGYEVVRTITSQYSIVSRMEAVCVRDSALKLFQSVGEIKRPTDLIRHLEDAFAKSESKLTNT